MKSNQYRVRLLLLSLATMSLMILGLSKSSSWTTVTLAEQFTAGYNFLWFTVDGGGTTSGGGSGYNLDGTIGQPDAGLLSNSEYVLYGGFWVGGQPTLPPDLNHRIYLPLIITELMVEATIP